MLKRFDEIERVARRYGGKRLPSGWRSELAATHLGLASEAYGRLELRTALDEVLYVLAKAPEEAANRRVLLQLAKAKEMSTRAMRSLDNLVGEGDSELSTAAENIRRRLDHADAAWEVQAGSLDSQLDDAMESLEVEAELAARMERLGI